MRVLNRILSTLLALALLAAAVVALVEIVLAALGRPPWIVPHPTWSDWLGRQTYDAGVVRLVLAGVVVLGLLLLVAALRRGRPGSLPLPASTEGVRVTAARRGLEQTLAAAASRPDGISGASVKAGRRSVRVQASTALREPGDLPRQVTASVDERLGELGLSDALKTKVSVSGKGGR